MSRMRNVKNEFGINISEHRQKANRDGKKKNKRSTKARRAIVNGWIEGEGKADRDERSGSNATEMIPTTLCLPYLVFNLFRWDKNAARVAPDKTCKVPAIMAGLIKAI